MISAVIGANYGDEGKGLIVDYLCSQLTQPFTSLVVRHSCGAQAGHTVQLPSGERHVFHHYGSGVFRGVPTFLSQFFISNPTAFVEEWEDLKKLRQHTIPIMVDPRSLVTTPWDMMINCRDNLFTHRSCGMGINETMLRSRDIELTMRDLTNGAHLKKLRTIINEYVPQRLEELDLDFEDIPLLKDPGVLLHFLEDCEMMASIAHVRHDWSLWPKHVSNIIFEGSQGLRLDMDHENFPHVTHARTGLQNVREMMTDVQSDDIDVYYVTRSYLTRHGDGPLPGEAEGLIGLNVTDETNIENPHQGKLRIAELDEYDLFHEIQHDLSRFHIDDLEVRPHLAVTCLDQLARPLRIQLIEALKRLNKTERSLFHTMLTSYGPTANDVAYEELFGTRPPENLAA